jgi:DNA polymerase-3 subunit alpha
MSFSHLHVHSHLGSRLDAIGSPGDYAERALQFEHKYLATTDHGRMNSFFEHQVQCLKYGITPIFGVEMYVANKLEKYDEKNKRKRTKDSHLILLVKNNIGYKNILKLNYLSVSDTSHFYYVPRVTINEIIENKEGLILGTGCMANPISKLVLDGNYKLATKLYNLLLNTFKDDFYTEIQLNEIQNQKKVNEFLIDIANRNGVPVVITGDVHYLEPGQDKLQTLAIAIRDKTTIDNIKFELESKHLFYHDEGDYINFNKQFDFGYKDEDIFSWCQNSEVIAKKCNFLIPKRKKIFIPSLTDNDEAVLIQKGKEGLKERFKVDNFEDIPKEYKSRLKHELEIIIRKGFASYFLIVDDITQFSIKENIYGRIGRGSVGGSILAYALKIHNLDPIKRGLLFERFMSEDRSPDLVVDYFKD